MDWFWRFCLAFAAVLLFKETDIWLIADSQEPGGLAINSWVAGALILVGVGPLLSKWIEFLNGEQKSKQKNQQTRKPISTESYLQNELTRKETDTSQTVPTTELQPKYSTPTSISAPTNLDYSKRCVIHWFVKEGDIVAKGGKIFTVSETLAYDEEKKTFTLTADKEYQIGKRHVGTANGADGVIHNEGAPIVELLAKENDVSSDTGDRKPSAEKKLRNADASRNANNPKRKTKKQIETDLNGLKKLKEDGLISDEVWKEKQKQILEDY